jgi:hypothetical protein
LTVKEEYQYQLKISEEKASIMVSIDDDVDE